VWVGMLTWEGGGGGEVGGGAGPGRTQEGGDAWGAGLEGRGLHQRLNFVG